tara:strand:+ start:294 stop:467 length:174 start_codon:yes stop_codon:yes gene_type:complete
MRTGPAGEDIMTSGSQSDLDTARRVIRIEREALDALSENLDASFSQAVDTIVGVTAI